MKSIRNKLMRCCTIVVGCIACVAPAQQSNKSAASPADTLIKVSDLTHDQDYAPWINKRLEELDPAEPLAYFELGEDVADEPHNRAEEELARTLFGLAYELDRNRGHASWIAPSSCIALASLARLESDRRWLWALANQLDARYAMPDWQRSSTTDISPQVAYDAAVAIGETLAGNGIRARALLEKQDVQSVILRYGQLLGFSSASGARWQIDQWAHAWPCPECGNERVVFRPNTDPPSYRECYTCRGNPGPVLSREQTIAYLRFESELLDGISSSWSAQLTVDYGAPLREPDPASLADVLGIDVSKPYWHEGNWQAQPKAAKPEPDAEASSTNQRDD